jgi:protein associated with RNAse G/E
VVYRKFDGRLHWHTTLRQLGEDEHGVWLGSPPGGAWRRDGGPWVTVHGPRLMVAPRDRWWTARFNSEPDSRTAVYCDVTAVPEWTAPDELTIVDLDLDVIRLRTTGEVSLLDADEFAEHRELFGYPPAVVDAALAASSWLLSAVTNFVEPFGATPDRYLRLLSPDGEDR